MKKFILRYKYFFLIAMAGSIISFIRPETGLRILSLSKNNLIEMLSIIPPIFILLGLLDVWVERETMMKYMGDDSGIGGAIIAFIMGSAAAGPLYAAFPIAGILLKKGVRLINVFIFIGAWSTTKVPMILFETSNLGMKFMLIRLVCNITGIVVIALIMEKTISKNEKDKIYENAQML